MKRKLRLRESYLYLIIIIMIFSMTACKSKNNRGEKDKSPVEENSGDLGAVDESGEKGKKVYIKPEMKGEISINVYDNAEWLETAAKLFTDKYPEMKVNVHVFYNGTDINISENGSEYSGSRPAGETREDYIAQLNNQLLSGNADDIILTSTGLALGKLIHMGVFEDLSHYLEGSEEINSDHYYMNIFDAYRTKKGKLYQMPLAATAIPLITFDKTLINETGIGPGEEIKSLSLREALNLGKDIYHASESMTIYFEDPRSLIGNYFTKIAVAGIDYEANKVVVNKEELLELLSIYDELKDYDAPPMGAAYDEVHVPFKIPYQSDVEIAIRELEGEIKTLQYKHDGEEVYLSPYYSVDFGINSKSKNKELSWEFLKFLASEEIQTLPSFPNAGINKKGLEARVRGKASEYNQNEDKIKQIIGLVDGWTSQITAYKDEDTDIIQISESVFNDFAEGNLTSQEAIDKLIHLLEQYISE